MTYTIHALFPRIAECLLQCKLFQTLGK